MCVSISRQRLERINADRGLIMHRSDDPGIYVFCLSGNLLTLPASSL
jgi:hypothetical protein